MPKNILLHAPNEIREKILGAPSGQQKINKLFELIQGILIPRGTVATVAQQKDYMKRLRGNGGARSHLRKHGIVILGEYQFHQMLAQILKIPVPHNGDSISVRLYPTDHLNDSDGEVFLEDSWWRIAAPEDPEVIAPSFSHTPSIVERKMMETLKQIRPL